MGALTLAITGAAGYLGRYTVAAARGRGHKVRALVRGATPDLWRDDRGISVVQADLADPKTDLSQALVGVDAVIHIAASLTGDDGAHARDTVAATRQLYAALTPPCPVVLAGSMAVYEGRAGVIDEASPIEPNPAARDAYLRGKLAQEAVARDFPEIPTRTLRLGAVFGPDRLWNAHIGPRAGPVLVRLAGAGEIPLVFAPQAAEALVLAAEQPALGGQVLNIIDDDLPDARAFLAALSRPYRPAITLPVPWRVLTPFASLAGLLHLPVPGLLRPATLRARMAQRRFPNTAAKQALGWTPAIPFAAAMEQAQIGGVTP